jgi:hypothetical protein
MRISVLPSHLLRHAALAAALSLPAIADAGVAGGYSFLDCNDAGGPASGFQNIAATGIGLGLDDDGEANATLPFAFPFYDATTSSIRIGNNGALLVGVDSGDVPAGNGALPLTLGGVGTAIMPFWDDLDSETGNVFVQSFDTCPNADGGTSTACSIIQWHDRPHYSNSPGRVTFQAILYANGNILFHYLDVDFGNPVWDQGSSATIGVQGDANALGGKYTQYAVNQAGAVSNGCPILFRRAPAIQVTATVTPDSNGIDGDECGTQDLITVAAGTEVEVCFTIRNDGGIPLTRHQLTDSVLGSVLTDFPFTLLPGSSAFITSNVVVDEPTVFTGSWVAYNPGPVDLSFGSDSAYVDVLGSAGFPIFRDGFEAPPLP